LRKQVQKDQQAEENNRNMEQEQEHGKQGAGMCRSKNRNAEQKDQEYIKVQKTGKGLRRNLYTLVEEQEKMYI
jgi:hypothetical protein